MSNMSFKIICSLKKVIQVNECLNYLSFYLYVYLSVNISDNKGLIARVNMHRGSNGCSGHVSDKMNYWLPAVITVMEVNKAICLGTI